MTKTKSPTILVTGAGGAPSTNFIRSLRSADYPFPIIGTDANPYYLFRSEADTNYLVPDVQDKSFIPIINQIITKHQVDFVHIQNDTEVAFFSAHRDHINAPLFLPPKEVVAICQDKYTSYQRWEKAGLTVPKTLPIHTEQDLRKAFTTLGKNLWIRSTSGAAGKWALPVDSYDIALAWITAHNGWGEFVAAERLTRESITWMSIWHNGILQVAQGRKRLYWEMAKVSPSGVTGVTGGGETVRNSTLNTIAKQAILAIDPKPHGLYGVDLTFDRLGIPNPTEINIGRFFTTHHFFTEAGLNMPFIYTMLGLGLPVTLPARKINPLANGLVWIRGVDFLPKLISRKDITKAEQQLQKLKKKYRTT